MRLVEPSREGRKQPQSCTEGNRSARSREERQRGRTAPRDDSRSRCRRYKVEHRYREGGEGRSGSAERVGTRARACDFVLNLAVVVFLCAQYSFGRWLGLDSRLGRGLTLLFTSVSLYAL